MRGKTWFVPLVVGLGVSSACGGGTTSDAPGAGGAVASGGSSTGGTPSATGGTTPSSGGSVGSGSVGSGGEEPTGGSSSSSGGQEASGGASSSGGQSGAGGGSGGSLPGACDCDAVSVWVCGVDGQTYDAGCGAECVPQDIACSGECPCDPEAGCGCEVEGQNHPYCEPEGGLSYVCFGTDWVDSAAVDLCEDIPTGAVRFCCPLSMPADAFCPE